MLSVRLLAACVASGLLAACGGSSGSDRAITREVEVQLSIAKDATIPVGVTLLAGSGPTREGNVISADWAFEAPTDWRPYREQAEESLRRAGYEPVRTTNYDSAYARHVPGDAYRVVIVREASSARVTVTFRAGPD